jgi:hypothetical protein
VRGMPVVRGHCKPEGAPCLAQSAEREWGELIIACETYEFMLGEAGTVVTVVVAVWIIERRRSTVHGCCEPSFLSES